jgi:hypothetical protein
MKNTPRSSRKRSVIHSHGRAALAALARAALTLGLAGLAGCGPSNRVANGDATGSGNPSVAIEAKPINLASFAVPEGAELTGKSSANLAYKTKGDTKSAYEFPRKQFLALGWTELPGTLVSNDSASGNFTGAGYKISATVYPFGGPGLITVMLNNHGNIDFAKLPVPAGAKPVYAGPLVAMFVTQAAVADTTEAVRQLLLAAGWEPHGHEGDSWHYKQGLNRISATISSAPAQGGKTMINYGGELLCGDLSAPPDAQDIRYTESKGELSFTTTADKVALTKFYQEKLAPTGWKQDGDKPFRNGDYDQMGYYIPKGDVLFLKVWPEDAGVHKVVLEYLSREAINELDKKLDKQQVAAELKKATAAAKPASTPEPAPGQAALPKVTVAIPVGATNVEKSDQRLKFQVAHGQGQAVTAGFQKQFKDAGWKEESVTLQAPTGVIAWSKDGQSSKAQRVFLNYTDFGPAPAEIKFSSFGARLEPAAGGR